MTSAVSGNATAKAPSPSPVGHAAHHPQPSADDVHAMRQALSAARQQPGPPTGKTETPTSPSAKGKPQGLPARREGERHARLEGGPMQRGAGDESPIQERSATREEHHGVLAGLNGQPGAPAERPMKASPPAPHVDASAFAQLLSEMWLRAKEKGAKEIRIQFGAATWPATGARLVRNAAGALDIQLHVSAGQAGSYGDRLQGLRERFEEHDVAIGALIVSDDTV